MTSKTQARASSAKLDRVTAAKQHDRASSAKNVFVPTLNKVELRPMPERSKDSPGTAGIRPSSISFVSSQGSTGFPAPNKPPLPKGSSKQLSAKVSTLELNVDNSNRSRSQMVQMAGTALTRPTSASYSSSGKMYRPVSAKVGKTPSSELSASRRPGTVAGHSPGTKIGGAENQFPHKEHAATTLMHAQLSAIDSENSFDHELRAHNRPTRTESQGQRVARKNDGSGMEVVVDEGQASSGGGDVRDSERGFDFTTMEELAHEERGNNNGQGGGLRDPRSGRVLPHTGIARDTHKTMRLYSGQRFDPAFGDNDDLARARARHGFRSQAIQLEVKFTERLRLATDEAHRFEIIRALFERVVQLDANFGDILAVIKEAYDERVDLVPTSDSDSVAMSAYSALKTKLDAAQERSEELDGEVHRLRAEQRDMRVARDLLEDQLAAARAHIPADHAPSDAGGSGGREAAALRAEVASLREQLAEEAAARERVEAALDALAASHDLRAPAAHPLSAGNLNAGGDGQAAGAGSEGGGDTARSAASGYDDHPTHRATQAAAPRPPSVPAISREEWDKVQVSRAEEAAEEAAWQAQEAAQQQQQQQQLEGGEYYDDEQYEDGDGYVQDGQWVQQYYQGEYDDEDEEVRRQLEAAGYLEGYGGGQGQSDDGSERGEEEGRGSARSREESMAVVRPTSKLSHGIPGRDNEESEEDEDDQGVTVEEGESEEEGGESGEWEEDKSHDTYSASEQTLSPGASAATSFVDSARSQGR